MQALLSSSSARWRRIEDSKQLLIAAPRDLVEKRRALDSTFSAFQLCVGCSVLHDFANPLQARRPACCRVHVPGEPDNGAQHRISRSQGLCLYDNLRQVRQVGNAFLPVPGVFSVDRARESSAFVTSRCARPVLLQERRLRHDHAIAAPRRCHLGRCCSSLVFSGLTRTGAQIGQEIHSRP